MSGVLDPQAIRRDFPIFEAHPGLVYLDNAATTQKPRVVIEAVSRFYSESNANILRGAYRLGVRATTLYVEAHAEIAGFIGARDWREVVFVRNATEAVNLVAEALRPRLGPGRSIVVTEMEHHSNLLPWARVAAETGAELRVAPVDEHGALDYEKLEELIDDDTVVVAVTHVSNVLGVVNDVRRVARTAHRHDALILVDGAQSVPHIPVDVKQLEADFLVFSGHKMLGPTGIGVLWARLDILEELEPPLRGGGAVRSVKIEAGRVAVEYAELPWRWEPGTPNIASAIGLAEAARYLRRIGLEEIEAHERRLIEKLVKGLRELDAKILGDIPPHNRIGIAAFTLPGTDPNTIGAKLGRRDIAVRTGFHCAEPLHHKLGFHRGTVRASTYIYNTQDDIDKLLEALREIQGASP